MSQSGAAPAAYDRRVTPARPDIAAHHLRGMVEAARYVEPRIETVIAEVADVKREPSFAAPLDTQAIRGEIIHVYEVEEGWAWGQLQSDGYVGYLPAALLAPAGPGATHRVKVQRTFLYPGPSMKLPVERAFPLNAQVHVDHVEGEFSRVGQEGFVWSGHLDELNMFEPDFVAVAERFLGVPYLWGGKSPLGVDCSGLIQTSLAAAGISAPRDTDMQEKALGEALDQKLIGSGGLRRGDLVFWKGHVGVMRDSETLLHANGYHMQAASEPLQSAIQRIAAKSFGQITSVRRLAKKAA